MTEEQTTSYIVDMNKYYCGHCFNKFKPKFLWIDRYFSIDEGTYIQHCDRCGYNIITCPNVLKKLGLRVLQNINTDGDFIMFCAKYFAKNSKEKISHIKLVEYYLNTIEVE